MTLNAAAGVGAPVQSPAQRLRLGARWLTRCGLHPLTYCGRARVPLDYGVASSPRIVLAYRWYPATDQRRAAAGTVVPVEGGPGYSSIASAPEYRVMYGSLLKRWNLLSVDNRGTGNSTALDCPAVQHFTQSTASPSFGRAVATCASSLNHRWRYANGAWVHASDLFTSALAARDLARVIGTLGLQRVDVYGDSYGSYFAQLFASLYPRMIRSLTLDSAFPVIASDPWYRSSIRGMPHDFNVVCGRSPACRTATHGSSWSRLRALAGVLRRRPVAGRVPGYNGAVRHVRMNVTGLVDLLSDAAGDPAIYMQIDAAARALLDGRDARPLLRLYDQRLSYDEAYAGAIASEDSATLYLAVACLDYRQLFDTGASPQIRSRQFAHALATLPASTFGPFTTAEWVAMDQNTETYSACLQWPSPRHVTTPALHRPLLSASTPVLVLGGELDTWTPPSDVVGTVLRELGGHGRFVELLNSTHVVGEGDTGCASRLVRAFVSRPSAIDAMRARCAQTIPPIRAVGAYPERLAQQPPLVPRRGIHATHRELQLAAAAIATAADAVRRSEAISGSLDHGLHGGTVHGSDDSTHLTLVRDQLIPGVVVSGRLRVSPDNTTSDPRTVTMVMSIAADDMPPGHLTATWSLDGSSTPVVASGRIGGQRVAGTIAAP